MTEDRLVIITVGTQLSTEASKSEQTMTLLFVNIGETVLGTILTNEHFYYHASNFKRLGKN